MDKNTDQFMDLNRETAMRLWNKQFGKETKAKDFAGREIAKGAYNDRNSDFGWNVDHILPQSKGGKTADHNLICCHILTNDQKGNKFPCFTANDRTFEILKVENHYEIHPVKSKTEQKTQQQQPQELNLYDSASGIRFYKKQKGVQNQKRFVGTVFIRLIGIRNTALFDFIEKIFDCEHIAYSTPNRYSNEVTITVRNYDMPKQTDTNELLDKCILLHTYLGYYFKPLRDISYYYIYYRVDCFDKKEDMYYKIGEISVNGWHSVSSTLYINELVRCNSEAAQKIDKNPCGEYSEYNYVYLKLAENLKKEVNGK